MPPTVISEEGGAKLRHLLGNTFRVDMAGDSVGRARSAGFHRSTACSFHIPYLGISNIWIQQ